MKMIRNMLGRKRKIDEMTGDKEEWVSWVKRVTTQAMEKMNTHKVQAWAEVLSARQEKWKAKLRIIDPRTWTKQAYDWMPIGFRKIGRRVKR